MTTPSGCLCPPPARHWLPSGLCATCRQRVLESQLAPVLLQILCSNTGLVLWRNAAGYDTERRVKYGLAPGSGDYVGCYKGRYVEVETKAATGRLSAAQQSRRALLTRLGCVYAVVRSAEDARELLEFLRSGAP